MRSEPSSIELTNLKTVYIAGFEPLQAEVPGLVLESIICTYEPLQPSILPDKVETSD